MNWKEIKEKCMSIKIPYAIIQKIIIGFVKIAMFILSKFLTFIIVLLSTPIWLPIVIWKSGLIISDNIIKHITSD